MFGFLIVLKKTYKEYYSEKLDAKNKIKEIKKLIKTYNKVYNSFNIIYNNFTSIWKYIPKNQRNYFFQKASDLINYGWYAECDEEGVIFKFKSYDKSLKDFYKFLFEYLNKNLNTMEHFYKKHDYKTVIENYKNTIDYINYKFSEYDIELKL